MKKYWKIWKILHYFVEIGFSGWSIVEFCGQKHSQITNFENFVGINFRGQSILKNFADINFWGKGKKPQCVCSFKVFRNCSGIFRTLYNLAIFRTIICSECWHIQNHDIRKPTDIFRTWAIFRNLSKIYDWEFSNS